MKIVISSRMGVAVEFKFGLSKRAFGQPRAAAGITGRSKYSENSEEGRRRVLLVVLLGYDWNLPRLLSPAMRRALEMRCSDTDSLSAVQRFIIEIMFVQSFPTCQWATS